MPFVDNKIELENKLHTELENRLENHRQVNSAIFGTSIDLPVATIRHVSLGLPIVP